MCTCSRALADGRKVSWVSATAVNSRFRLWTSLLSGLVLPHATLSEYMVSTQRVFPVAELTELAMNMVIAFYAATFPGLVQDLPEVIESEKGVLEGTVA
jgi:hypothetical protein